MDLDTQALVNYERKGVRLFHRPIETIQVPLLITVSRADRMLANDMEGECRRLCGQTSTINCTRPASIRSSCPVRRSWPGTSGRFWFRTG